MAAPAKRVTLFKAPIYLACTVHEPTSETFKARSLLHKVSGFNQATPTDLNVVLHQTLKLAHARNEDVSEIASHFYSRMMRKISRDEEATSAKRRVRSQDPSSEVFSEFLRKVYAFGCWQLLTIDALRKSQKESHARYLETLPAKWARI